MKNTNSLVRIAPRMAFILMLFPLMSPADSLEDKYFSNESPVLSDQEKQALAIAKRWQAGNGNGGIKPFAGPDGSIQFAYGVQSPSVVCAVLQICDITLEPGEFAPQDGVNLGDSQRWTVSSTVSGSGQNETQHILLKPMDVGLSTTVVITTNRRAYHIRLKSHRTDFMPKVSFTYPQDRQAEWGRVQSLQNEIAQKQREENTMPGSKEYLGNLSFDYEIKGKAPWKPIRAYNDGHKTIVQLPETIQQAEAPTLLLLNKKGSLFSEPETGLVNYRLQGDRFIVDSVFNKAVLISGVGKRQVKVTITRKD